MSYLFELRTPGANPGYTYMITDGANRDEALAHLHEKLGTDDEASEIVVVAVHTVH